MILGESVHRVRAGVYLSTACVWLGHLIPESLIPFIMAGAHYAGL